MYICLIEAWINDWNSVKSKSFNNVVSGKTQIIWVGWDLCSEEAGYFPWAEQVFENHGGEYPLPQLLLSYLEGGSLCILWYIWKEHGLNVFGPPLRKLQPLFTRQRLIQHHRPSWRSSSWHGQACHLVTTKSLEWSVWIFVWWPVRSAGQSARCRCPAGP